MLLLLAVDLAGVVVTLVAVVVDQALRVQAVVLLAAGARGWHRQVVVDGEMDVPRRCTAFCMAPLTSQGKRLCGALTGFLRGPATVGKEAMYVSTAPLPFCNCSGAGKET